MLSVTMLSVTMLSVTMLSVTMLSVTMLSVSMLSDIMLHFYCFADCRLANLMTMILLSRMGDKVAARIAATSAGLPIIPGTDTAISTSEVSLNG